MIGINISTTPAVCWHPSLNKPVLNKIRTCSEDPQKIDRMYMLFYIMIGGLATITQTQVTDLYNVAKADKSVFRFHAKRRITEAKKLADDVIGTFRYFMQKVQMYQLWLDATDNVESELKLDVAKQFYFLDNQLLRHKADKDKLYANIILANGLSKILCYATSSFIEALQKNLGVGAFKVDEKFINPIEGLYTRLTEFMHLVYPASLDREVFGNMIEEYNRGFDVIGMKVLDYDRADKCLADAVALNGVNIFQEGHEGEQIDNKGTLWNETQIRALKVGYYKNTPINELAEVLGRTPAAVRAKARQLGFKRPEAKKK